MARYTPNVATTARRALEKLRRQISGGVELVYDNYNALVIGFSASERASDAVISIALYPRWVSLFFLQAGAWLRDPSHLLKGTGTRVRHVVLSSADDVETPAIRALIREALARADPPIDATTRRRLIIKSVSAKQRPRRPGP